MVNKIIYPDGRDYACDDCKKVVERFKSIDDARDAGWGVAQGRSTCWCPSCAPQHRHVGRGGAKASKTHSSWLPKDFEQTKIENLG